MMAPNSNLPVKVVQVGLGPIGLKVVQQLLKLPFLTVVGAVDPAPDKKDRPLRELLEGAAATDIVVSSNLQGALAGGDADIAVHCTSSFLDQVTPQLSELAAAGLNVVSTTEELSYPWFHHPAEAAVIDRVAKDNGITIVGTGVNPGFVMDVLPILMTQVSETVESVRVERIVDAGKRRGPLQRKVGIGISQQEFQDRAATGRFGHMGLVESVAMLAGALDWKLDRIEQKLSPKVADGLVESAGHRVEKGSVLGIQQTAWGYRSDEAVITLHLEMYLAPPEPRDGLVIQGTPPIDLTIRGGVHGDVATVSAVTNTIPRVLASAPGLMTMKDLALPGFWNHDQR